MKLALRVVCLIAFALLLSSVPVRAAEWTPLGERSVDYRLKSETIEATAGAGAFSKLKLEVTKNILQIKNVKVTFLDGQSFSVDVNEFIGVGQSHVIELPSAKEVKKVEFTYRRATTTETKAPALVKLFGSV
jgi:hypothetical protein